MKKKRNIFIGSIALLLIGVAAVIYVPELWIYWDEDHIRIRAMKAKTKVQLNQWAVAMEEFKSTYGAYPEVDGSYVGGASMPKNILNSEKFAIALTGRYLDGSPLLASSAQVERVGNTKLLRFYTISDIHELYDEGADRKLIDALGNTEIAVLYDKNGDGFINTADVPVLPTLHAAGGGTFTPTKDDIDLGKGIRAGVLMYSPGKGRSDGGKIESEDAIFSWK